MAKYKVTPIDPNSPAGKAATEALSAVVASVRVSIAERRAAAKASKKRPAAVQDAA